MLHAENPQAAVNSAPNADKDNYRTKEGTPLTVAAEQGVLSNDEDANRDTLSAMVVDEPTHGTLTFNSNGSFTYTPAADFTGRDSFTYKANDGSADSNVTTVDLRIRSVNDAPVGTNDNYSTNEDTPLTVAVAQGVLANDSDVDGDSLRARLVEGPAHGTVKLRSDGSFTYTPAADYNGADSFTYRARDGETHSNDTTVNITIAAVNDAPVAANDSYTTNKDTALTVAIAQGVLANDSDVEGSAMSAALVSGPAHGTLTLNANGTFTYTPAANYTGGDSFTYRANDGTTNSGVTMVSLVVSPDTSSVQVNLVTDPTDATKTALQVFGTNESDIIRFIKSHDDPNEITVLVNGEDKGNFSPTGKIIVFGLGGDDNIKVRRSINLAVELHGDAGDDRLRGGSGPNILVGGDGDDRLIGGRRQDLMIGGDGTDRLIGTRRGDIMIGDSTTHDQNSISLDKILDEWTRTDLGRSERVAHLTTGGGLNSSLTLTETTILDDQFQDRLRRTNNKDWLFPDEQSDQG